MYEELLGFVRSVDNPYIKQLLEAFFVEDEAFIKKFKNKERFEKKEWYVGTVDDQNDISLNKYEKKNVDTMAAELKKRGLR